MNAYYSVNATPSKARLMTKLAAATTGMHLDDSIRALAEKERVDISDAYKKDEDVVQDIIDYGFRCIVPGDYNYVTELILEAATKSGKRVVFLSDPASDLYWKKTIKNYCETTGNTPNAEVLVINSEDDFINADLINSLLDAVVVSESQRFVGTGGFSQVSNLTFSVSQIVILHHSRSLEVLKNLVDALFPSGPNDILTSVMARRELETKGFKSTQVNDLLFLLNTTSKFIG